MRPTNGYNENLDLSDADVLEAACDYIRTHGHWQGAHSNGDDVDETGFGLKADVFGAIRAVLFGWPHGPANGPYATAFQADVQRTPERVQFTRIADTLTKWYADFTAWQDQTPWVEIEARVLAVAADMRLSEDSF